MADESLQHIQPFVQGLTAVLKTQFATEATLGKPFVKGTQPEMVTDILSVISLVATSITGTVILNFPKKTYLTMIENMLGETFTEITSEITDGASEMLNMIYGHAKTILNESGHDLEKSLPKVFHGPGVHVQIYTEKPIIILPISTTAGEMTMEFVLG